MFDSASSPGEQSRREKNHFVVEKKKNVILEVNMVYMVVYKAGSYSLANA